MDHTLFCRSAQVNSTRMAAWQNYANETIRYSPRRLLGHIRVFSWISGIAPVPTDCHFRRSNNNLFSHAHRAISSKIEAPVRCLTIRSSRTRFTAAHFSGMFVLYCRRAAGRLNSGVRPLLRQSTCSLCALYIQSDHEVHLVRAQALPQLEPAWAGLR